MCLIAYKPKDVTIKQEDLYNAWSRNYDGSGVMFWTPENGIKIERRKPSNFETIERMMKRYEDEDIALHLRYATSGEKEKHNAHPFRVLRKKSDGEDLVMMHNGVLSGTGILGDKVHSDTANFVKDWLTPTFQEYGTSLLKNELFMKMLGKFTSGSKLLFLDDKGEWTFVNKEAGSEKRIEGAWVSNVGVLDKGGINQDPYKVWTGEEERKPKVVPVAKTYHKYGSGSTYFDRGFGSGTGYDRDPWDDNKTHYYSGWQPKVSSGVNVITPEGKKTVDSLKKITEVKKGFDKIQGFTPREMFEFVIDKPEEVTTLLLNELIERKMHHANSK